MKMELLHLLSNPSHKKSSFQLLIILPDSQPFRNDHFSFQGYTFGIHYFWEIFSKDVLVFLSYLGRIYSSFNNNWQALHSSALGKRPESCIRDVPFTELCDKLPKWWKAWSTCFFKACLLSPPEPLATSTETESTCEPKRAAGYVPILECGCRTLSANARGCREPVVKWSWRLETN